MRDRDGQRAARQKMVGTVAESDIDRLLTTARGPVAKAQAAAARAAAASAETATADGFAARLDTHRAGRDTLLVAGEAARAVTMSDIPVFILYACLGIFTRIWTDVTLYFDFGEDNGFRMFAIGVSMALHGFILAIVANAWRAKWDIRIRNLLAMAALGGYLGFRMLTQL